MSERTFALHVARRQRFEFDVAFDDTTWAPIVMDEPAPLGEGHGPDAARLLAAAIGNCLAASLLFCMQKARVDVRDVRARVEGTLERNRHGRLRIGEVRVTLAPTVAGTPLSKLARCVEIFEDYCVVTQSVREGIDVLVDVEPDFVPVEDLDEEHELAVRRVKELGTVKSGA